MFDKTFKDLIFGGLTLTNPMAQIWAQRLGNHGEVQVNVASGKTYSMHQGDIGTVDDTCIILVDREGTTHCIMWTQVEAVWTHRGYLEG